MKFETKKIDTTKKKGIKEVNKLISKGWQVSEENEKQTRLFRAKQLKKR